VVWSKIEGMWKFLQEKYSSHTDRLSKIENLRNWLSFELEHELEFKLNWIEIGGNTFIYLKCCSSVW